jgi:F0F1-type ATP synthase, epsilon subunit (mitochondrial delta subunit)
MSEEFKVEIINPEKSFISKDKVTEVVVPAYEGDIGILKDHISIISNVKPVNNKNFRNIMKNEMIRM